MATTEVQIRVHVVLDVNGQPVKVLADAPNAATLHDQPGGLEITVHLDAERLAEAIMPHLTRKIYNSMRLPPMRKEGENRQ